MLRTNYLVHWTGKDICVDPRKLTPPDRQAYVERVMAILDQGFWMTRPPERIQGANTHWLEYQTPLTCFTEIRLSSAGRHAARYGLAGVVVTRDYVLHRCGTPVLYVRNNDHESVVGNIKTVTDYLQKRMGSGDQVAAAALNFLGDLIGRLKPMSDYGTDNFLYLEEQEWRVIHRDRLVNEGLVRIPPATPPAGFLPVDPSDVQGIVFPDALTRVQVFADQRFQRWLAQRSPLALTPTVQECEWF